VHIGKTGGKTGGKGDSHAKTTKSHSAKAGLQVSSVTRHLGACIAYALWTRRSHATVIDNTLTFSVPLRPHKAPPAQLHPPKDAHRRKSIHLPNRGTRIPDGRSARARWQRGQGSESQAHHAAPPAARDPRRRRTGRFDPRDHRLRRRPATHQSRAAAQGGAEEEEGGWGGVRRGFMWSGG
jgi:hypothetical protein